MKGKIREQVLETLAAAIRGGIPLGDVAEALYEEYGEKYREVAETCALLKEGSYRLAEAIRPLGLPPSYLSIIEAGERSGNLEAVLMDVAETMRTNRELTGKSMRALLYPVVVLFFAILLAVLTLKFVMTKFLSLIASLNVELPVISQMVFSLVNAIASPLGMIVILGAGAGFFLFLRRNLHVLRYLPGIGKGIDRLLQYMDCAVLYKNIALYISAGLSQVEAIRKTAPVLFRKVAREHLQREEKFFEEKNLSDVLRPIIPTFDYVALRAGERSGTLEETLNFLVRENRKKIQNILEALPRILEPLLIVLVGMIVGTIVVALYSPLFALFHRL